MALPFILPALARLAKHRITQAVGAGVGGGALGFAAGRLTGPGRSSRRRKRRKLLSNSEIAQLVHIKTILGRTAAAEALPFFFR